MTGLAAVPDICPLGSCDGSGWILGPENVARPCDCRERRIARARSHGVASVVPAKYRGVSFDRPPITELDSVVVDAAREFLADLPANLASGQGMWLYGDVGTGKTSLAMLVSKTVLEAGHTVAIYSLPKLLARIRRTYEGEAGEDSYSRFFERLASVDLLHIDDLGAEKSSEWVLEQLYALVNERYEATKSVIVTTNFELEDLEKQIGSRTVSRLVEMCDHMMIPMYGVDSRTTG